MRIMLDNALSSVKTHQSRLEAASRNVANLNTPENPNVDLVDNMVSMMVNERGTQANTATIKTADRVAGEIIDLIK